MYLLTAHLMNIQGHASEATSARPDAPVVPHQEPQRRNGTFRVALTGLASRTTGSLAPGGRPVQDRA
jgi:hypothetical protein